MSASSPLTNTEFYQNGTVSIVFELPDEVAYVTFLRKKARRLIGVLDLSREDADDIEIILCELAANASRHARGGKFKVYIELTENKAILSVVDNGNGFALDAIPPPATFRPDLFLSEGHQRMGGLGLPLVKSLSDQMEVILNPTGGVTVRVTKILQPKS